MKITTVESFVVEQSLEIPFAFSQWEYSSRAICLVRVTAEDGTYGWGEGYGPAPVVRAGIDWMAQHVVGRDVIDTEGTWQKLYLRTLDYARSGVLMASVSAIDIALWDLKGKLLGRPVHALLGGKQRDRVKVYATGLYFTRGGDLAAKLADEARGYIEQGYTALKMKVGHSFEQDVRNVRSVRSAIGSEPHLMIDSNHWYDREGALALCQAVEPEGISWFEEPLSPEDYEGYALLRQRTTIPIAGGECEYLVHGFKRLLSGSCVDIAQPDTCAAGGLTEVARIAELARIHRVELAPHCWGTGIAFAVGLHLVSTLESVSKLAFPEEPILEMDRTENPLRDLLTQPCFKAVNGFVGLPDSPGLGVDVNPELLEAFGVK